MNVSFSSVWYSSSKRFKNPLLFWAYDATGTLTIDENQLVFESTKVNLTIRKPYTIEIVRTPLPWAAYLILNVLLYGYFVYFKPELFSTTELAGTIILFNILGLLVCWTMKWVRVTFSDETGQQKVIHFRDGRMFGWSGTFGGTTQLVEAIKTKMNT